MIQSNVITFTKKENQFDDLYWIVQALGDKKSPCQNFVTLSVKDGEIVATDSKRLHILKASFLEDGRYVVKVAKSKIELTNIENLPDEDFGNYPDYKNVIPNVKNMKLVEIDLSTSSVINKAIIEYRAIAKIIRALPENMAINVDFLREALSGEQCWNVFINDKNVLTPIVFKSESGKTAVIMPIKAATE